MTLTFFALSNLLIVITSIVLITILLIFGNKRLHLILALFNLSLGIWGAGALLIQYVSKLLIWKLAICAVAFTTPIFGHFVFEFLSIERKKILLIFYLAAVVSSVNILANIEFHPVIRFNSIYFPHTYNLNFKIVFLVWFLTGVYNLVVIYTNGVKRTKGSKRNQSVYIFYASLIAFLAGPPDFFTGFNFNIYPYGNILIPIYGIILTYAILKHQLMDINIAIKKGLIYSILVAVITAGYLLFVISIGRLFQGLVGYKSFLLNLSAIFIIAILFNPLRNKIQRFLDKRFFKGTLESLAEERERLKQELFQTEKLAYVGNLASSVAHEIKNPLTAIKTFLEYLPQKYQEQDFKEKFQTYIPKEIGRIENVVNQLLDLAKPRPPDLKPTNIIEVIDSTINLLENNLKLKRIEVKKDYSPNEIMISGDDEQLRQVFLNLFLNSIQAMSEGGTLAVSTSIKHQVSSIGQSVSICIQDNGCGISEENLNKLFTPFFTTKKEGIGLGLMITQEIISQHRGSIKVESKINEGTKFAIELLII